MEKWEIREAEIASEVLKSHDLTFFARDLGFPDHTAIHGAVKPIMAKWIARFIRARE